MQAITLSKIKNRYIYPLMKVVKNKRPYYARWWYFISLLILGWSTPITKHWDLFLFGKKTIAYPIKYVNSFHGFSYTFLYSVNGRQYTVPIELEPYEIPDPEGVSIIYNPNNPADYLSWQFEELYSDENLFFPVGFQIAFGVFFLMIRFKDL